jgi:hypothetical protein
MDTAIKKVHEKVSYVSNDEKAFRLYRMRELAQMDYISGINHVRCECKQEGRQERRREASPEILKLLKEGKSVEEIGRLFNVSDVN